MNHLETYQFEKYVPQDERNWLAWANSVEAILKHSLDGNQNTQGYSLDYAYNWFKLGAKPQAYANSVKAAKLRIANEGPTL